jgi:hypothetical protein
VSSAAAVPQPAMPNAASTTNDNVLMFVLLKSLVGGIARWLRLLA